MANKCTRHYDPDTGKLVWVTDEPLVNYDKAVTRAAASGDCLYLMFDAWWPLEKGRYYRVNFKARRIQEAL